MNRMVIVSINTTRLVDVPSVFPQCSLVLFINSNRSRQRYPRSPGLACDVSIAVRAVVAGEHAPVEPIDHEERDGRADTWQGQEGGEGDASDAG